MSTPNEFINHSKSDYFETACLAIMTCSEGRFLAVDCGLYVTKLSPQAPFTWFISQAL